MIGTEQWRVEYIDGRGSWCLWCPLDLGALHGHVGFRWHTITVHRHVHANVNAHAWIQLSRMGARAGRIVVSATGRRRVASVAGRQLLLMRMGGDGRW